MNTSRKILALSAFALWACSSDPQDAGVWVDEPAVAFDESSSSIAEEISSSSEDSVSYSSSSAENPVSSSSYEYGDAPITLPPSTGCAAPLLKAAPSYAPASTEGLTPVTTDSTYGVIPAFTRNRVKALVADGMPLDSAIVQAKAEFFEELGIDSLLSDKTINAYKLALTLYYLYGFMYEAVPDSNIATGFVDGTLDSALVCNVFIDEDNGEIMDYGDLDALPPDFIELGCVITGNEYTESLEILQNIWRKCVGLPYCNSERIGLFNNDSTLICKKSGWTETSPLDFETLGIPCDADGKYIVSKTDSSRTYVCNVETGWTSTTTVKVEMADTPCEKEGTLHKSTLNPGAIYICRDSMLVASNHYGMPTTYHYEYNVWDIATPFESEVIDEPCDAQGKVFTSTVSADSFHVCIDGTWESRLIDESSGTACDEEGAKLESSRVEGMYYVCYGGYWLAFNDTPCEDGERHSTAMGESEIYKINYVCYNGKWISNRDLSWTIPYEYYFNPDIKYGSFTDPRDGHVYRTTEFAGKTWMAENLKYLGSDDVNVDTKYCWGDSCVNTGYYYTMEAAKVACPAGWQLPTSSDMDSIGSGRQNFSTMSHTEFGCISAGIYGGSYHEICGYNGTDAYGLSFTATGSFSKNMSSYSIGYDQYFWITDGDAYKEAKISQSGPDIYTGASSMMLPIRCVKD